MVIIFQISLTNFFFFQNGSQAPLFLQDVVEGDVFGHMSIGHDELDIFWTVDAYLVPVE